MATTIGMSRIENIVYDAYNMGKRDELFALVSEIRKTSPKQDINEVYDQAWNQIRNK